MNLISVTLCLLLLPTCNVSGFLSLKVARFLDYRRALCEEPLNSKHVMSSNTERLSIEENKATNYFLPATFQAIYAKRIGKSFREVAEIRDIPMEQIMPRAGEVVVKVLYAGINGGCETFRCRGEHIFAKNHEMREGFPLGAEGSGIVVQIGTEVERFEIGDHVSFLGSAFSEYVRLRADGLIKVTRATAETAALRISAVTACGVLHTGQAKPGNVVLVTAAAGGSGHFAVQLAKQAGCTVVGTCSSDEKARSYRKRRVSTLVPADVHSADCCAPWDVT
jgi:NADPH-dependent curcumin reductase CurA